MSLITRNNLDRKMQKIGTISFTLKTLQIDVIINMIYRRQQLIKCIFEILFVIGDASL